MVVGAFVAALKVSWPELDGNETKLLWKSINCKVQGNALSHGRVCQK